MFHKHTSQEGLCLAVGASPLAVSILLVEICQTPNQGGHTDFPQKINGHFLNILLQKYLQSFDQTGKLGANSHNFKNKM